MTSPHSSREACPVCAHKDLLASGTFVVPLLCSVLYPDENSARQAETGRLTMTYCRNCSHIFNSTFEEARISYTEGYDAALDFSPRFVSFASELAQRLNETYRLAGKTIIDVGCGKGHFLNRLCSLSSATGIGFDRSFDAAWNEPAAGVRFIQDYFGPAYADVRPDLVTCRHVLEHVSDPVDFLRALQSHPGIGPETAFYFEVPNALFMLREARIWDLIYEHFSYFTPNSLRLTLEQAGFEIIGEGAAFDGQYLFIEARPASRPQAATARRDETVETLVRGFNDVYRQTVDYWHRFFVAHPAPNIVAWGAGVKGITFVNIIPGAGEVAALIDLNPNKHGRFAPTRGTPVVAPEWLRTQNIQSIVVMNPIYHDEIREVAETVAPEADVIHA